MCREAADKVINGTGKLEELIVCSQEIAASTAQLVVSSRVKAKRSSQALSNVQDASKNVSRATGNVVATVKTGAQIIEDQGKNDWQDLDQTSFVIDFFKFYKEVAKLFQFSVKPLLFSG